jgi:very-short-patch-repair endonuclease
VEGWQPKADGVVLSLSDEDATIPRNSKNYMELPYNPNLKKTARKLRKAGNLAEVLLWEQIKNKKFKGLDFDRQKIVGNYIVDFFCSACNVVIEIDGWSHDYKQEYDIEREAFLRGLGLDVIHIADNDVRKQMPSVLDMLYNHPALATHAAEIKEPPRPLRVHPSTGGEPAPRNR